MVRLTHSPLAVLMLAISTVVVSLPQQLPMRAPSSSVNLQGNTRVSASPILQFHNDNLQEILLDLANSLDRGFPEGWESLVQTPDTTGTSSIEITSPSDLERITEPWGIDPSIRAEVLGDIRELIEFSLGEGYYVAQHFSYALPGSNCHAGERPVCLSTLFLVTRPQAIEDGHVRMAELAHVYVQAGAETYQQKDYYRCCHRCWFRRCCHTCDGPRGLTPVEMDQIQQVLSTNQAIWAHNNLPAVGSQLVLAQVQEHINTSGVVGILPLSKIDAILRKFLENRSENKEVYKDHDEGLLTALQEDTRSHRQNIRNMKVTIAEQDVVYLIENMLSDCFKKAGIEESVADWFNRIYPENRGKTISLECEVSSQTKETIVPPVAGCKSSTSITSRAMYSWVLLSPRENNDKMLECLLINSNIVVDHRECIRQPNYDSIVGESTGAVVRWGIGHQDGSFDPMFYLVQWNDYPMSINKALLDILRFATAASYLKVSPFEALNLLHIESTGTDMPVQTMSPGLIAIGEAMKLFAEGWAAIAGAFRTSIREDIRIRVCLGFNRYEHNAKAFSSSGIERENLIEFVEHIISTAQLPNNDDLKTIMLGVKYSDDSFTWTGESMSYTAPDGKNHFLYVTKNADPVTDKINLIFGMVNSGYTLAPDMMIVRRTKSILGGIFESEETEFRSIPHELTLNDTVILEMYFEMVVFRQMAMVSNLPVPEYPDLSSLCG
ncbi:hypothetical protein EDD21DRAFT_404128 [Dissophora ornata]|nr:hypothetical protein EDD21DRAFT_404128 [Dissophora ornata]